MKQNEEYTLQFDFADSTYISNETCKSCGKLVSVKNITEQGYCVECVMNNMVNDNEDARPNESLYKEFRNLVSTRKIKTILSVLFLPMILLVDILSRPNKDANKKMSFNKANKTIVEISDYNWVCPCCNLDNNGPHYCRQCGVYPKFRLK